MCTINRFIKMKKYLVLILLLTMTSCADMTQKVYRIKYQHQTLENQAKN